MFSALSSDFLVTDYAPSGRHSSEAVNCDFGSNTTVQKFRKKLYVGQNRVAGGYSDLLGVANP